MSIVSCIHSLFSLYTLMLVVAILSSWFEELDQFSLIQFIRSYTDPYLNIFRRCIPPLGPLDMSPIAAFFFLRILESCIMGIFLA